jgi:hypothetical protein
VVGPSIAFAIVLHFPAPWASTPWRSSVSSARVQASHSMSPGETWEDDRKVGANVMHGKVVEWDLSNIGEEYKWSIDYRLEWATFFKALLSVLADPKRRAHAVKRGPDIIRLLADPTLGMINLRSGNNSPRPISGQAEMAHAEAVILGEAAPDRRWLPPAQNVAEGFAGK